jgi:hypothetical protein
MDRGEQGGGVGADGNANKRHPAQERYPSAIRRLGCGQRSAGSSEDFARTGHGGFRPVGARAAPGGTYELTEYHTREESYERHEHVGGITQAVFFLNHGFRRVAGAVSPGCHCSVLFKAGISTFLGGNVT